MTLRSLLHFDKQTSARSGGAVDAGVTRWTNHRSLAAAR